jgi:hypothetical protein
LERFFSGEPQPAGVSFADSDLDDFVSLEAGRADANVLNSGVQNRFNADDVGFEGPLGANTNVLTGTTLLFRLTFAGYVVPGHGALSANFTFSGHTNTPS